MKDNYSSDWSLVDLVVTGVGIHNGQLHRCLGQIQIKLFEDEDGLSQLISTSSIIEGVNTSAENVIIWRNRIGNSPLNDFTFKNIIGRSGRMLRHFVGRVFILEEPPTEADTQLTLTFPDELLGEINIEKYKKELTKEQIAKIIEYREEMSELLGHENYKDLIASDNVQNSNSELLRIIASSMRNNPSLWNGIGYLNSDDPDQWTRWLYKLIRLSPSGWDSPYKNLVEFTKIISMNWVKSIPQLLTELKSSDVDVEISEFFKLERKITFKLGSIIGDVALIYSKVFPNRTEDISEFAGKVSHAFLPKLVFEFEEYGLPRMLSRKIHNSKLLDFENIDLSLHEAIQILREHGLERILAEVRGLSEFDEYVLEYFFQGIENSKSAA